MRYAIVSDLHANRQAWEGVLADIESCGVDAIVCLGDVVGYGPCPQEVLDDVRQRCHAVVVGNHDAAACGRMDASIFNDEARSVVEWTRQKIDAEGLRFLTGLPEAVEDAEVLFVHAEVEYPERFSYVTDPQIAAENLAACRHRIVFVGHTHEQAVFVERGGVVHECASVDFTLTEGCRYLVNAGSVGEPRDPDDLRGRYVIYDSTAETVNFRAVEFDFIGYRADLDRQGLPVVPYFLRALEARTAPVELGAVLPRESAMRLIPIAPSGKDLSARAPMQPSRLVVVPTPLQSRESSTTMTTATSGHETGAKGARRKSRAGVWITLLLLLAAIGAGVFWKLRGSSRDEVAEAELQRQLDGEPEERLLVDEEEGMAMAVEEAAVDSDQATRPLAAAMVGYWAFDENFGSQFRAEKFDTVVRQPVELTKGRFGKSVQLQSTSSLNVGSSGDYSIGEDGLTVSFWYAVEGPESARYFAVGTLPVTGEEGAGWQVVVSARSASLVVDAGEHRRQARCLLPAEDKNQKKSRKKKRGGKVAETEVRWHHVAAVIDGTTGDLRIYLDSAVPGGGAIDNFPVGASRNPIGVLSIGTAEGAPEALRFSGRIDDLAIWKRPMTAGELAVIRAAAGTDEGGKSIGVLLRGGE